MLDLTFDEVLTTTRSVRKRLDLDRPVDAELIEECLSLAIQAPSGSNLQSWGFVVVTDEDKRKALGDLWRRGYDIYKTLPVAVHNTEYTTQEQEGARLRIVESVEHLAENLHRVPVHLIPCLRPRTDTADVMMQAAMWGSIIPACWSFMLAARSRGLGTCWTNLHQFFEREAAEILEIPYEEVMQCALIPVAHTIGTEFKPAPRDLSRALHWNRWG